MIAAEKKQIRTVRSGFTLVEVMIVAAIVGLLAGIAIPAFIEAQTSSRASSCINNLRIIEASKDTWALSNSAGVGDTPSEDNLSLYFKGGKAKVFCPSDPNKNITSSYALNAIGTMATCLLDPATHVLNDTDAD